MPPDDLLMSTRDSLPHHGRAGVPSVQVLCAVPRFRRRRSCRIGFGCLGRQAHGRQDLFDGVPILDQGDEAQRALAARTAVFPDGLPPVKSIAEAKAGIGRLMRKRHARH